MESDALLVEQAQQGDRSAFDGLLRRHFATVHRIASRYAVIPEDAKDLTQLAFVSAFERLKQLDEPAKFGAWITAIARNEGLMWLRRREIQPLLIFMDDHESTGELLISSASTQAARLSKQRQQISDFVSDALALLTAEQRMAIELHYFEGYDYQETAALLDVPVSAVRGRLDRARRTLRKELHILSKSTMQEFDLTASDLTALQAASTFVATTTRQYGIDAICFSGDGCIVSTDGHRIFCYTSKALSECPLTLIDAGIGRVLKDQYSDASRARLIIGKEEAAIRIDSKSEIRMRVIKESYVSWRKCIPDSFRLNITARVGDWLQALEKLSRHYEEISDDALRRMVMVVSSVEGRIRLSEGAGAIEKDGLTWETSVSFPIECSVPDADFVMAISPVYVEQAIRALGLSVEDSVMLAANESLKPVLIRPATSEEIFVVTMPMEMPGSEKSEEPS